MTNIKRQKAVYDCYNWVITNTDPDSDAWRENLDLLQVELKHSGRHIWEKEEDGENPSWYHYDDDGKLSPDPLCNLPFLFDCSTDLIHVSGKFTGYDRYSPETKLRINVFDKRNGQFYMLAISQDPAVGRYWVVCCNAYFVLHEQGNIGGYGGYNYRSNKATPYYVFLPPPVEEPEEETEEPEEEFIAIRPIGNTWQNIYDGDVARIHYRFGCCHYGTACGGGAVGTLRRTENEITTIEKVFVCGIDITDAIPNLQDNFCVECCGDYAVVSTGQWTKQYEVHEYHGNIVGDQPEDSYAILVNGTRCVPARDENGQIILYVNSNGVTESSIAQWETDDTHHYRLPNPLASFNDLKNTDLLGKALQFLPFKCTISNNRWAALYHCGKQIVIDQRLTVMRCFRCQYAKSTGRACANGYSRLVQCGHDGAIRCLKDCMLGCANYVPAESVLVAAPPV